MSLPTPTEASRTPDAREGARTAARPSQGINQGARGFWARGPLGAWRRVTRGGGPTGGGPGVGSPGMGGPPQRSPFRLLRRRLVVTTMVIVAVVLAALCVVFYTYEAHATLVQVDQQLATEARSEAAKGLPHLTDGPDEDETPYQPGSPNLFSIVVAPPHRVLQDDDQVRRAGLPDWTSADAVLQGKQASLSATVERNGFSYRVFTVPIRDGTRIVAAVQSGTALTVYNDQLLSLLRVLVLLSLCALLLTTLLSLWLAERALAPARAAFARQRQFAAAASHELRTPLAFIRSQAELIAEAPAAQVSAAEVSDDAREILAEVDYLTRMTRDLLLLARDEHDARALALTSVDLCAIVRDAVATAQPLAQERSITLVAPGNGQRGNGTEARAGGTVMVRGDADRLRQLTLILVDNALRYTPRGGTVSVDVRAERKHRLGMHPEGVATLTVRDTGIGIAPSELSRIFEPFYRANAPQPHARDEHATGITDGGTGLGLALAQWIAHAHDGEIVVHSTPGAGATVMVTLPLRARHAAPTGGE